MRRTRTTLLACVALWRGDFFGVLQHWHAGGVGDRQGENDGSGFGADAGFGHDSAHDVVFLRLTDDDEQHIFFRYQRDAHELFRQLRAGAAGVNDGAVGGLHLTGGVHDKLGVALVGDHD